MGVNRWNGARGTGRGRAEEAVESIRRSMVSRRSNRPEIDLLCVQPRAVEYWESTSPKPIRLLQVARSVITKQPPNVGSSGTLTLHGGTNRSS
jgi:hypothetical protein